VRKEIFFVLFAIILVGGTFIRFYDLTVRPIHHDEGVVGWFRLNIYNACLGPNAPSLGYGNYAGICSSKTASLFCDMGYPLGPLTRYSEVCGRSYKYDPLYHGPFPYFFGAWVFSLFGISDYTLRLPGCAFAAASILLLLFLRKSLGDIGVLAASAFCSFSPVLVYYSQYAFFDDFFFFFSLGAFVCAVRYYAERKNRWLYLCAADMGFLYSVKENALIFTAVFVAYGILWLSLGLIRSLMKRKRINLRLDYKTVIEPMVFSVAIFAFVCAFFYTNMFMNSAGLWQSIANGVLFWVDKTNSWSGHFKPFDYFYTLLLKYELLLVLFSILSLFSLKDGFSRFCAWWAVLSLIIYSMMPYKTPFIMPNFILPMALLSGRAADYYTNRLRGLKKWIPVGLIIPALLYSAASAWDVTYVHYSDNSNGLAYVPSTEPYNQMVSDVKAYCNNYTGNQSCVHIKLADYWPLPWSLRDCKLLYGGGSASLPVVISEKTDYSDIIESERQKYGIPVKYEMRPGVYVYVYARRVNS